MTNSSDAPLAPHATAPTSQYISGEANLPSPAETYTSASGLFISFEGGDGCGKTTQSRILAQWLGTALAREVVHTREPGGTELGAQIRQLVLHGDDMGPRAEALLYAADRSHHIHSLVKPALERGAVVITDRYLDSSVAYQAGGRELTSSSVRNLSLWATGGLMPHLTVLIDLDPKAGAARFADAPDRLERAGDEFHQRTWSTYLQMAKDEPERWIVLDGSGSIEDIAVLVRAAVVERLSEKFPQYAQDLEAASRAEDTSDVAGQQTSPVQEPHATDSVQ